jgi:hypothetical protein
VIYCVGDTCYSVLIAVDPNVGLIKKCFYKDGTTSAKFLAFVSLILLPSIRGTGRRIIMFDNLSAHLTTTVADAISFEGHFILRRPIHSPDFGPVESCFHFTDNFLEKHSHLVNDGNLATYLEAGLNLLTPLDIRHFYAYSHFPVPGLPYLPYTGDN